MGCGGEHIEARQRYIGEWATRGTSRCGGRMTRLHGEVATCMNTTTARPISTTLAFWVGGGGGSTAAMFWFSHPFGIVVEALRQDAEPPGVR